MANYTAIRLYDKDGRIAVPQDCWPVGSIYVSVTNTNPTKFFGGTWVSFGAGRTLIGVDTAQTEFATVQKTGGSKTHTHTQGTTGSTILTSDQMPSHSHTYSDRMLVWDAGAYGTNVHSNGGEYNSVVQFRPWGYTTMSTGGGKGHTHTNPTTASSSSLEPYITVYFWKRTA